VAQILIVDDSKADRELMERTVEGAGHMAHHAADAQECMKRARNLQPDLILIDTIMPKPGGFDILRMLKRDETTARIRVVMVAARIPEDADRLWGQMNGAAGFLAKSFTAAELARILEAPVGSGRRES
jgi:twitching motility two-component system response regulator PilH